MSGGIGEVGDWAVVVFVFVAVILWARSFGGWGW